MSRYGKQQQKFLAEEALHAIDQWEEKERLRAIFDREEGGVNE